MIIDDDFDFAESLSDILTDNGYETCIAQNVQEVKERSPEFDPRVALIDVRFGDISGLELIEYFRESRPATLCVMITAYAIVDSAVEALKRGAYDYLRKPVSPEDLLATIDRCFQKIDLEAEKEAAQRALRNTEEQLIQSQKMEAVGRLAGGVAHDFNNILTIILGFSDILLTKIDGDQAEYLNDIQQIRSAALRASSLTKQLLAFSRKHVVSPEILNVNKILKEIEKMLMRLIGENVELELKLANGIGQIKMDMSYLEQAILNLVVNSRDAMPKGGKITISTKQVSLNGNEPGLLMPRAGSFVCVCVADIGIGMSQDTLQFIFEPFFTTKDVGKGTGLGLSTVFGIIQQCEGTLEVDSEPGKGTRFYLYFPVHKGEDGEKAQVVPETHVDGTETILLLEDDTTLRELVASILTRHGYEVHSYGDPHLCLREVAKSKQQFDLIVSDIVMPGFSGPEIVEKIYGDREWPAVMYMSGYTNDAISSYDIEKANVEFIQKPFALAEFMQRVRSFLDAQ